MKIGIVLGGGGAKGSFQAGVIKGLTENGFEITAITGTSVGALNGALVALDKVPEMMHLWESITEDNSFYPNYTFRKTYGIVFKNSIYSNEWLKSNIDKYIDPYQLNNINAFFGCVSTDLISGKSIFADNCSGIDLKKYILASASLPPAFPPIQHDVFSLVDGGLTSPIPVSELLQFKEAKYDKILIIPAGKISLDEKKPSSFIESNIRVIDVMYQNVLENSLKKGIDKYWKENKLFTLIEAPKNSISTLELDHNKIMDFMEEGYILGKNFRG